MNEFAAEDTALSPVPQPVPPPMAAAANMTKSGTGGRAAMRSAVSSVATAKRMSAPTGATVAAGKSSVVDDDVTEVCCFSLPCYVVITCQVFNMICF